MKIDRILSRHRRDFHADYKCEGCGYMVKGKAGYDDTNFYDNVIPNMKCPSCGKSRNDLGITGEKRKPKYPSWKNV